MTCIKQQSVLKISFGLLFEWPLKTGLTVLTVLLFLGFSTTEEERAGVIAVV